LTFRHTSSRISTLVSETMPDTRFDNCTDTRHYA
jgi:hypothetical protein